MAELSPAARRRWVTGPALDATPTPRRRQIDLAIAATAIVERVPLLTYAAADLRIVDDLVDARRAWRSNAGEPA